jgi:hypothetical protein
MEMADDPNVRGQEDEEEEEEKLKQWMNKMLLLPTHQIKHQDLFSVFLGSLLISYLSFLTLPFCEMRVMLWLL